MSDNLLRLIPDVPGYVPSNDRVAVAVTILCGSNKDARVEVQVYPEIRFVDQGSNFEAMHCSCCGVELDLAWWGQAMDRAAQNRFVDLSVRMPCCGCAASLNDIRYHWPAGFARFCITISNPPSNIDGATLQSLNEVLVTTLRQIWVHR
jgi:hypothetical protein